MCSSPRLGVVRRSMQTDPLLIKAPLGRSRSRGLAFPGPDFTYGKSSSHRCGGVAEVLSSWKVHSQIQESPKPSDIMPLNQAAVKSGMVTSKEMSHFRAQKTQSATSKQRKDGFSRHLNRMPDITFGVRNRPSPSMSDILSHQYGQRWLDEQLNKKRPSDHKAKIKRGYIPETRTSLLRKSKSLPVIETPPKATCFTQVGPALSTFRSQEARLRAFRARQSDFGSRTRCSSLGT